MQIPPHFLPLQPVSIQNWFLNTPGSMRRLLSGHLSNTLLAACLILIGAPQTLAVESPTQSDEEQGSEPAKRPSDPIPPLAIPLSDAASLNRVPEDVKTRKGTQLVLDRKHRQLLVLSDGRMTRRFPAAVGTNGWETPAGRFRVFEKVREPVWTHPVSGDLIESDNDTNPLGSRWIGFHRDCKGRSGWDGEQYLDISGCTVAGFHGTPYRWTVGRAISHGCVRLYEENVQEVFDLVRVGTQVTVLP